MGLDTMPRVPLAAWNHAWPRALLLTGTPSGVVPLASVPSLLEVCTSMFGLVESMHSCPSTPVSPSRLKIFLDLWRLLLCPVPFSPHALVG